MQLQVAQLSEIHFRSKLLLCSCPWSHWTVFSGIRLSWRFTLLFSVHLQIRPSASVGAAYISGCPGPLAPKTSTSISSCVVWLHFSGSPTQRRRQQLHSRCPATPTKWPPPAQVLFGGLLVSYSLCTTMSVHNTTRGESPGRLRFFCFHSSYCHSCTERKIKSFLNIVLIAIPICMFGFLWRGVWGHFKIDNFVIFLWRFCHFIVTLVIIIRQTLNNCWNRQLFTKNGL